MFCSLDVVRVWATQPSDSASRSAPHKGHALAILFLEQYGVVAITVCITKTLIKLCVDLKIVRAFNFVCCMQATPPRRRLETTLTI
jgi:hypothetical protein